MKPTTYKTTKTDKLNEWETLAVQFSEEDGTFYGYTYRISKFGNLTWILNRSVCGNSLESCKRSANRMLRKVYGCKLDGIIAEGTKLIEMHASFTDESVHESFKAWAAGLFE
jgi:hypothetical protein